MNGDEEEENQAFCFFLKNIKLRIYPIENSFGKVSIYFWRNLESPLYRSDSSKNDACHSWNKKLLLDTCGRSFYSLMHKGRNRMIIAQISDTHILPKEQSWLNMPATQVSKRLKCGGDHLNKLCPYPDVLPFTGDSIG